MKTLRLLFILAISVLLASCSVDHNLTSPNGRIILTYAENNGQPSFSVTYNGVESVTDVVELSSLGLFVNDVDSLHLSLTGVSKAEQIEDDYTMITGKRSHCTNRANERTYSFIDSGGVVIDLIMRAYDDGVAFRYRIGGNQEVVVNDETTTFAVAEGINRWMQRYAPTSYEDFFPLNNDGVGRNRTPRWGYPALFEISDSVWMLVSEAGIGRANCATYLSNEHNASAYKVMPAEAVNAQSGWTSPWRVAIIGSLADVVESTLVTDVSEPCKIEDTQWIHPGVVSWIYWAYNHGSKDYQIVKKYIDMAAELNLPYVLIDWEWDEMSNGGTLDEALEYAKGKDVKTLLWYNSSTGWIIGAGGPFFKLNTPQARENEYSWLEEKGVAGVKIDFFSGDSLATMNYYIDLLEDAAKHHLLVNFHGATVPRGWQRTYPNMMSVEAVYGAEWYNNGPMLTSRAAQHNCTLPFTRNVIGSMDYTPCTFSDSQFPHITTHAHELALTVAFESGLQHLADSPESYLAQPQEIKDFFSSLPNVWDDTRLLSGYPGDHVVIARRSGQKWYVAAMNGTDQPMSLPLALSELGEGECSVKLFKDGEVERSFGFETLDSVSGEVEVDCLPKGGYVAVIEKK